MCQLDPGDRRAPLIDRLHEVLPEQLDVMTIGFLQLGVLVLEFAAFARGIKVQP
jgi:hypothetical protein